MQLKGIREANSSRIGLLCPPGGRGAATWAPGRLTSAAAQRCWRRLVWLWRSVHAIFLLWVAALGPAISWARGGRADWCGAEIILDERFCAKVVLGEQVVHGEETEAQPQGSPRWLAAFSRRRVGFGELGRSIDMREVARQATHPHHDGCPPPGASERHSRWTAYDAMHLKDEARRSSTVGSSSAQAVAETLALAVALRVWLALAPETELEVRSDSVAALGAIAKSLWTSLFRSTAYSPRATSWGRRTTSPKRCPCP